MDKVRSLKDFPRHEESPFAINVKEKYVKLTFPWRESVDENTGELFKETQIPRMVRRIEDADDFVKFHHQAADLLPILSTSALYILAYIMKNLKYGEETIILYRDLISIKNTKSANDVLYTRGISNLLHHEIIARGKHGYEFFVNTNVIFNGSKKQLIR